jgi:hypothetical protein
MKKLISLVFVLIMLSSCASVQMTPQQETAMITIASRTVGYTVGRVLGEYSTDLQTLCMIPYDQEADVLKKALIAGLQQVWLRVDESSSAFAVMSVNDFVDLIGLTVGTPDVVMTDRWKRSMTGFCQGVTLAAPIK